MSRASSTSSLSPLLSLGWDATWEESFAPHRDAGLLPGRVITTTRESLRVGTAAGEREALVPGRLIYRAESADAHPCVGDWLALRPIESGEGQQPLLVEAVLPRRSAFVRRAAGRRTEPQALAANVDLALLVSALDGDWSSRRLERWLALATEAEVPPVVVLTKADLCNDPAVVVRAAAAVAAGVPVHAVDALGGAGVETLRPYLRPGITVVLLGSSGVGKSTLVNQLAGREVVPTAAAAADGRGRHTTTRRELLPLPGGALLLDTPGLREVGLWLGDEVLEGLFPEVAALAARCRFRDCAHDGEPGCAVHAAVAAGELDPARLASLHQLGAERAALRRRTDERAARAEKQRIKALCRAADRYKPRQL
ncbi:MAG TPA: ribosome small subunit-dependent GTPase A [Thermoanaerobaculia bacterium]|nr:ribosome small subunit-dependent GTPase A [Thermoanaerobaculia bacterium]